MNNWCLVTFNNWGVAQNFSRGFIVLLCCYGCLYCNQHPLGTSFMLEITASSSQICEALVLTQIFHLALLSKILAPRGKTSRWNRRMIMRESFSRGYHSTSNRNWILLTANLNFVKRNPPPPKIPLLVYCREPSKHCAVKILEGSCLLLGLSSRMSCLSQTYLHSRCSIPKTIILLHIFFINLEFLEWWTYGWIMGCSDVSITAVSN